MNLTTTNLINIFFDADALFSACYSIDGAAYGILQYSDILNLVTSSECLKEADEALKEKFNIEVNKNVINHFQVMTNSAIDNKYFKYVRDIEDRHVIQEAHNFKCEFLVTYNIKDYLIHEIENDLGVKIVTPGKLLFYIRNVYI